ncbi:MAG: hypothetical protein GTO46_12605 [Gemmatimonadetes bacterium]|nr:hypothetical protein [Gemmatimonadota bacterium]NIO32429.1 hypothetical protein [Gemmatimonadota bacterium]
MLRPKFPEPSNPHPHERRPTTDTSSTLTGLLPVFRAVVCTVVPEADELNATEWGELMALVDESLRGRPSELRRQLRLFLRLVEWLPLFRYGRRFSSLESGRRARFLAGLQNHRLDRIRVGFWGLRTLALLGYYGRGAAAAAIGYHPDPAGWEAAGR